MWYHNSNTHTHTHTDYGTSEGWEKQSGGRGGREGGVDSFISPRENEAECFCPSVMFRPPPPHPLLSHLTVSKHSSSLFLLI